MYRFLTLSLLALTCFVAPPNRVQAQLDLNAYAKFLSEHRGMKAEDLLQEYPAGMFRRYAPADLAGSQFGEQVSSTLNLTSYERELISRHSFMVTERLSFPSYNAAYLDAYVKDLPVYVSSDAILHALHRSYDNMLKRMEERRLLPAMEGALAKMRAALRTSIYSNDELVQKAVRDADLYLTVASALMATEWTRQDVVPQYPENVPTFQKIMREVVSEGMVSLPMFSDNNMRDYDFSQFKPRGHYTDSPDLKRYFQCLIWLGRTEIYITPPEPSQTKPTDIDIRRQCMLAVILSDLATTSNAQKDIEGVDNIIRRFVGEQDNLTLTSLGTIIQTAGAPQSTSPLRPEQLHDDVQLLNFQSMVRASGGEQQILSQLLYGDPFGKLNEIKPAAAFMLLGQRFILDSYILGNVVYDKVEARLMPSPLDVMFTMGNDATAQLLAPELKEYDYALNLAGLRYLTTTLTPDYWESSLYTTWLNAIRALNPGTNRASLPTYMQTGAWAQKQLNAQLTSWAELRHDNILYAKQSYTGGVGCFYPSGYVEPVPELYARIGLFARNLMQFLDATDPDWQTYLSDLKQSLDHISTTCGMLESIARSELAGMPISASEKDMLENWIINRHVQQGCESFSIYDGVYPKLYYGEENRITQNDADFVIADVHTQPTDDAGNLVGRVLHVATGRINTAVLVASDPSDGCATTYAGPVGSFYQHITSGFDRMSDEDWVKHYAVSTVPRPAWVYTYLANAEGAYPGEPQMLATTGVSEPLASTSPLTVSVLPNPTSAGATITFDVPASSAGKLVSIVVVDAASRIISNLQNAPLVAGHYKTHWDGKNASQADVASGTYYVRVQMGDVSVVQQVVVVR